MSNFEQRNFRQQYLNICISGNHKNFLRNFDKGNLKIHAKDACNFRRFTKLYRFKINFSFYGRFFGPPGMRKRTKN